MTTRPMLGATLDKEGVTFGVWAPNAKTGVSLELTAHDAVKLLPMVPTGEGQYVLRVPSVSAGTRYAFRIDDGPAFPDPWSRFQPEGVHGPSEVIDPQAFVWTDVAWRGPDPERLAIYELHVGAMTPEGTFAALEQQLPTLVDLGITVIELMPVAQSSGRWNWGYDGVDLFAPANAYGRPDDFRQLVNRAHELGLAVMLDVVYNHFGPEGAYQGAFSSQYFSDTHQTDWGVGLNWDGPGSEWVRRYVIANAEAWIREYHLDGLRLDATHALIDDSPVHIVQEITAAARAAAGERRIIVHAEDGRHEIARARSIEHGGDGTDGIWADDFHHELRVLLTHATENYYASYSGSTADLASAINDGFSPVTTSHAGITEVTVDDPASAFVFCIQNHDQVGNRPFGDRLESEISPDRYAVASTLLLFAPETPLIFMGQEFAATTPFLYFTDHPEELGKLVTEGRRNEFAGFGAFQDEAERENIPDPQAEETFLSSKLRLDEREIHAGILNLYRTLLRLRQSDPVLRENDRTRTTATAPTSTMVTVHRWFDSDHRLLLANFGTADVVDLGELTGLAERDWRVLLTTTDSAFGGSAVEVVIANGKVTIPEQSAVILVSP